MFRSPESAIDEIITTLEEYPADTISFADDNLTISKKWFNTFIDLYIKKINLPFQFQATVNTLSEEIIQKLAKGKARIARIAMEMVWNPQNYPKVSHSSVMIYQGCFLYKV